MRVKGSWNFIPRGKRKKVHTRLGLETIKVSGIDLKRRELARRAKKREREKERAYEGARVSSARGVAGGLLRAVRSINGGAPAVRSIPYN